MESWCSVASPCWPPVAATRPRNSRPTAGKLVRWPALNSSSTTTCAYDLTGVLVCSAAQYVTVVTRSNGKSVFSNATSRLLFVSQCVNGKLTRTPLFVDIPKLLLELRQQRPQAASAAVLPATDNNSGKRQRLLGKARGTVHPKGRAVFFGSIHCLSGDPSYRRPCGRA